MESLPGGGHAGPRQEFHPDLAQSWKKILLVIWISQFIAQIGFSFALPFTPFYLQKMGVTGKSLDFWVAVSGAAPPLAMMIFAPIWGYLADKFGRRKMLLRSYIGGVTVLVLMGFCDTPLSFVFLRLLQGALSGTVSAAQTLVATHTPDDHNGFALGALNSAVYSGVLAGSFIGGIFADVFGYRTAFVTGGVLLLIPVILILFFIKEHFVPLMNLNRGFFSSIIPKRRHLILALPILVLMGMVMFARQFDISFIPLFVQALHGSIEGASIWTGTLSAVVCFGSVLSGFLLGYLADRYPPGKLAVISALLAAVFMFTLTFAHTMLYLFCGRFLMVFMSSGLDPALQIWLCRKTIPQTRGLIFGWASSVRSFGWFLAPLVGGTVTAHFGIRALFVVGPVFFLILMFAMLRILKRFPEREDAG